MSTSSQQGQYYFAYGSNLNIAQMKERCPGHRIIGQAILADYQFIFTSRGYASIVPKPYEQVPGVVYWISHADEKTLDRNEGVADKKYYKVWVNVRMKTSLDAHIKVHDQLLVLVYIDFVQERGIPKEGYLPRILTGFQDHQFSDRDQQHIRQ
jgi:gamma-glutamylcyclotransferase